MLILLCDQPLIFVELIDKITAVFLERKTFPKKQIVACQYGETFGVPALFYPALFPALLNLTGTTGAKKIIQTYIEPVIPVPFPAGLIDVDTPQDYQNLLGGLQASKE